MSLQGLKPTNNFLYLPTTESKYPVVFLICSIVKEHSATGKILLSFGYLLNCFSTFSEVRRICLWCKCWKTSDSNLFCNDYFNYFEIALQLIYPSWVTAISVHYVNSVLFLTLIIFSKPLLHYNLVWALAFCMCAKSVFLCQRSLSCLSLFTDVQCSQVLHF